MHGFKSAILAILPEIGRLLVQPTISAHKKWPEMVLSASTNQVWTKISVRSLLVIQIQIQAICPPCIAYRASCKGFLTIVWKWNTRLVNCNISSYGLILGVQILAYILLLYCTICSHSIHGATIVSWQMQVLIEEMHF